MLEKVSTRSLAGSGIYRNYDLKSYDASLYLERLI